MITPELLEGTLVPRVRELKRRAQQSGAVTAIVPGQEALARPLTSVPHWD